MSGLATFLAANPDVIRVRIARVRGSSPREAGAEMFVAPEAVQGTIGGGQLEYMAIDKARDVIFQPDWLDRIFDLGAVRRSVEEICEG